MALLNRIYPNAHAHCRWANGKTGVITDLRGCGVYRFYEYEEYEEGSGDKVCWRLKRSHPVEKDNPIVAFGITSFWLTHRSNPMLEDIPGISKPKTFESIKEMFDAYTKEQFKQFQHEHKDNPNSWKWDWDYEYYAKVAVAREWSNRMCSEDIYEYLPEEDQNDLRSVVDNYIEYLTQVRQKKGYVVSDELKILRTINEKNVCMVEREVDDDVENIARRLMEEGMLGADAETNQYVMLDKGRERLAQLEDQLKRKMKKKQSRASIDTGILSAQHAMQAEALLRSVEKYAASKIRFSYEWFAVWRMMNDFGLLVKTDFTSFAKTMNSWFPDVAKPCTADSLGDYASYLGGVRFAEWDEDEFLKRKSAKQSLGGFRRLRGLCETLDEHLLDYCR